MKKIRWIDILIIVFVIAIAVVFFLRRGDDNYSKFKGGVDIDLVDMSLTYETKGIRGFSVDSIELGDVIFDDDSGTKLGVVTAINVKPSKEVMVKNNGEAVSAIREEYFDLYVTINSKVYESENKFLANGNFDLKLNSNIKLVSKRLLLNARLVNFGEYSEEL